jgi:para-aminobenzoate synthetase / 4-amino-4-deoxychorismate lyase
MRFVWGDYSGLSPRLLAFVGCREVVRADEAGQVKGALRRIEAAVERGAFAAGFVSYEAAGGLDSALAVKEPGRLPLVYFGLFDACRPCPSPPAGDYSLAPWRASLGPAAYAKKLAAIQRHITSGDTYQVNLTWRLRSRFKGDDRAFFDHLCRAQEAAYCAYVAFEDQRLLSASPELFFELRDGLLTTRPMKGTRRRGRWPLEDVQQAGYLRRSAKDRAENAMIVDLLRNDLGRVAETGSVQVPAMWHLERFPTIWQMTSTVTARLRRQVGLPELFEALFPCGSITGAPKVSTMRIIRRQESTPRGAYTGCIGYIAPGGHMRFNVAIRTVSLDLVKGTAEYGVGGGVTAASSAGGEYREGAAKALVLRRGVGVFKLIETLLYQGGKGYYLRRRHLKRLVDSAAYFGFCCDLDQVTAMLDREKVGRRGKWRVRLLLDRAGKVGLEWAPVDRRPAVWRVGLAAGQVDAADVFLYHKTTRRQVYLDCLASVPGCDEAILRNRRGEVTECCSGNIVAQIDQKKWTPPLRCGLLGGTLRAELLARGEISERVLRLGDLKKAERLFMINSVRRWVRLELQ